jgi:hypothetical protein
MSKIVRADGFIPHGARVLVRGARACVATEDVANATALSTPSWARDNGFSDGQSLAVAMDAGLGARDLHALAAGPIMDPNALYLPAGKLSKAECDAREARIRAGEPC